MSKMKKIVFISLAMLILSYAGLVIAQEEPPAEGEEPVVEEEAIVEEEVPPEPSSAPEEVEALKKEGWIASVLRFYKDGKGFMHIILLLGLIALGITIERAYKLWLMQKFNTQEFYIKLKTYLRNEKYDEAIKICQAFRRTSMGSIFLYGLKGFVEAKNSGKVGDELSKALQQSFDEAALNELPKLEKRIHYLETFANMATLLGLLGTIFGLITAFRALADLPPEQRSTALTKGISMAMNTTAFGLIIALPTMLAKAWLTSKASAIMNEIDEYSVKTIHTINANI